MQGNIFLTLIQNVALLLATLLIFDLLIRREDIRNWRARQVLSGLFLGGAGILLMSTPWTFAEGIIFDTRSVLISTAGLFFGVIPTLIGMVITAAYRLYLSGAAALTGVFVIFASGGLGLWWRHLRRRELETIPFWQFYLFGLIVHLVMLALMFTLPLQRALEVVRTISLPVLVIYPLGNLVLGGLLQNRWRRERLWRENQRQMKYLENTWQFFQQEFPALKPFMQAALEKAQELTGSPLGFLFLYDEASQAIGLKVFSPGAAARCRSSRAEDCFALLSAGNWRQVLVKRKPVWFNRPEASAQPAGRFLAVPAFEAGAISAVLGLAGAGEDYTEEDALRLSLFMDSVWKTVKRFQMQGQMRLQSAALESAGSEVVITDRNGTIEWVNPAFTVLTGHTREESLGRNPRELVRSGRHSRDFYRNLWDTILAGQVWRGELVNRRKDGSLYTEEQTITPVRDEQAEITHFVAIKQDITARKQHERELEIVAAVSAALRAAQNRAKMAPVILDQLILLLEVEGAALEVLDANGGEAIIELGHGAWESLTGQRIPAGAGLTRQVLESGRPYLNNNVRDDPRLYLPDLTDGCQAVAGAPLMASGQVTGLLWIGSGRPLTQHDLRLLTAVGDIAANALHRAELHEQTRRRADEFAALYAAAREVAAQPSLDWLLETVIIHALDLLSSAGALVALCDPVSDELEIAAVRGLPITPGRRLQRGEGVVGRIARTWKPLILDDCQAWADRSPHMEAANLSAAVGVPLISGGALIGVLLLAETGAAGRRYTAAEADLLELLASHAASAIHSFQVRDEAQQRADQLALLYDAGLALNGTLEPHSQLEYLAKVAGQALRADVVEFFRSDPTTGVLGFDMHMGYQAAAHTGLREHASHLVSERGLAGTVAQTRLPLNVPDLLADPRYMRVDPELRSGLWVPVQHQGRLRGVLGVLSRRLKAFTEQDERLLLLFANQTAVAIQNAHLLAETERRLCQVQALRQIDVAIASNLELRPVLNILLDQTLAQLGVDAAAVLLYNQHEHVLEHAASRGFRSPAIERSRLPLGRGPAGRAAQAQQRVLIRDLSHSIEQLLRAEALAADGFAAYCAEPLIFRGQIKGVLEVFQRQPLDPSEEWLGYLETLAGQAALAVENVGLFDELQRSNAELTQAYDATIEGWSRALDLRDQETEGHSRRVTEMTVTLARALGVSPAEMTHVRRGALLHDIGKMGVPDAILHKAGPLTDDEWAVMRTHPTLAFEMLSPIAFLRPALDIPYCHHEKWDGTGYPRGLHGEQIPLAARLFAVVDVYDALTNDRPYRPAWPAERVRRFIQDQAGTHFDPNVAAAFLRLLEMEEADA